MSPIRLTVNHMPGETATSLVSRLAARNGIPTAEGFCRDHRLRLQDIADGEPAAIHGLSEMAGVDPNRLFASAFRRSGERAFRIGIEILRSNWTLRRTLRVCPMCLLEDTAASSFKPDAAMYGRACWQVSFVRTCHVHGLSLTTLQTDGRVSIHDFAAGVRQHAPDMARFAAEAERRAATGLEDYVVRRISGEVGRLPFLDRLQLGLAARFCEVLGTVRLRGRVRRSGRLDGEELRTAGDAGFALAAGGDDGVRSFLAGMVDPRSEGRSANGGAQSALGALHDWLADNRNSAGQADLLHLVREVVAANMPLGGEDVCLWKAIGHRRLHSIRSASLETQVHPKRLRKVLHEAGIIGDDHIGRPDHLVTFPAAANAEFLARLTDTLSLAEVATYLDADRVHAKLLFDAGFLVPVYPRREGGKRILAFARSDADSLLSSLTDRAKILESETDGAYSIPRAAKRVPCGAMDIVRLIRDKRLPWVGRLSSRTGYLGIRVKPDEVRPLVFPDIGISLREASTRLGVGIWATRKLRDFGFLKLCDGKAISYKTEVYNIDPASVTEFHTSFIALSDLVPIWGRTGRDARSALKRAGIVPAINLREIDKMYFIRNDAIEKSQLFDNRCKLAELPE